MGQRASAAGLICNNCRQQVAKKCLRSADKARLHIGRQIEPGETFLSAFLADFHARFKPNSMPRRPRPKLKAQSPKLEAQSSAKAASKRLQKGPTVTNGCFFLPPFLLLPLPLLVAPLQSKLWRSALAWKSLSDQADSRELSQLSLLCGGAPSALLQLAGRIFNSRPNPKLQPAGASCSLGARISFGGNSMRAPPLAARLAKRLTQVSAQTVCGQPVQPGPSTDFGAQKEPKKSPKGARKEPKETNWGRPAGNCFKLGAHFLHSPTSCSRTTRPARPSPRPDGRPELLLLPLLLLLLLLRRPEGQWGCLALVALDWAGPQLGKSP